MKIIYLTDIHGSFARVFTLLRETTADNYIISGDLLDMPFYSIEPSTEFYELQNHFHQLRLKDNTVEQVLEDYVLNLYSNHHSPKEIKQTAEKYLLMAENARENMEKKYRILNNILSTKSYIEIYVLPGNYDMELSLTDLAERNIHLKKKVINGLSISGYGSADVRTPGFPEKYLVEYNGKGKQDTETELYSFLVDTGPDIIAAHHPPYGILDRLNFMGSWGSTSLRTYCDNNPVLLCLSGHIHEEWGLEYVENTVYLNPSNFGELMTPRGEISEGGYFFEIDINEDVIPQILLRKIEDNRIYDIIEYNFNGDNYVQNILDTNRLTILRNYSAEEVSYSNYIQVPELRIFRDIRNFFRIHQTEQTDNRIRMLEDAVKELRNESLDVSLDVLGSVNLGLAQSMSDVDAVLYIDSTDNCLDENIVCSYYEDVTEQLKEKLGRESNIEIIDQINLNIVKESVRNENFDCESTQRFAAYRAFCRAINYRLLAPVEDMLNEKIDFRMEVEENIRSYLRAIAKTKDSRKSFDKYMTRMKTRGITIPDSIITRIESVISQNVRNTS